MVQGRRVLRMAQAARHDRQRMPCLLKSGREEGPQVVKTKSRRQSRLVAVGGERPGHPEGAQEFLAQGPISSPCQSWSTVAPPTGARTCSRRSFRALEEFLARG